MIIILQRVLSKFEVSAIFMWLTTKISCTSNATSEMLAAQHDVISRKISLSGCKHAVVLSNLSCGSSEYIWGAICIMQAYTNVMLCAGLPDVTPWSVQYHSSCSRSICAFSFSWVYRDSGRTWIQPRESSTSCCNSIVSKTHRGNRGRHERSTCTVMSTQMRHSHIPYLINSTYRSHTYVCMRDWSNAQLAIVIVNHILRRRYLSWQRILKLGRCGTFKTTRWRSNAGVICQHHVHPMLSSKNSLFYLVSCSRLSASIPPMYPLDLP